MAEEKPKFEWCLLWGGKPDDLKHRAALEPCKTFHIWKDYNIKVVTHTEFLQMVEEGKTAPPESYWGVNENEFGIMLKSHLRKYDRDLENLSMCYQDFLKGWDACEARVHFLMDWDEAIEHNKIHDKWYSKQLRRYEFTRSTETNDVMWHDWRSRGVDTNQLQRIREHEFVEGVIQKEDRRGRIWYVLTIRSTGPQYLETIWDLARNFDWIFSFENSVENPCTCEIRDPYRYKHDKREPIS